MVSIGGVGDMFVILGSDPKSISSQYINSIVGKPTMPPDFAIGWQQCRWGYRDTDETRNNVEQYQTLGIPLDGQWQDIDYLDNYRDFTYDPDRYADLP